MAQATRLGLGGYPVAALPSGGGGGAVRDFTGTLSFTPTLTATLDTFGAAVSFVYDYQNYPLTMATATLAVTSGPGPVDFEGTLSFAPVFSGSLFNTLAFTGNLSIIPAITAVMGVGGISYAYSAEPVTYPITMTTATLTIGPPPPPGVLDLSGNLVPGITLSGDFEFVGTQVFDGNLAPNIVLSGHLSIHRGITWEPVDPCESDWVETELCDA